MDASCGPSSGSLMNDAEPAVLERLLAACETGHGRACGVAFAYDEDQARRTRAVDRGCELHDADACVNAALLRVTVPADAARGWALIETECERGSARACMLSYVRWVSGRPGPVDAVRGVEHLVRACELGDDLGCASLADLRLSGEHGVPVDRPAALRSLEERCALPSGAASCASLAEVFAVHHPEGPPDPVRATELYDRACRAGHPSSCRVLGGRLEAGLGVASNFAEASRHFELACRGRDEISCTWAGYMHGTGMGTTRDLSRAFALWERACRLGHDEACERVSRAVSMRREGIGSTESALAQLAVLVCEGDDFDAEMCMHLADRLATGRGIARSLTQAVPLYRRSCDAGQLRACASLGALFAYGVGLPVDREAGLALLDRACTARVGDACGVAEVLRHPPARPRPFGM